MYPSQDGIANFWYDITERKQAEQAREKLLQQVQASSEELSAANEELQSMTEELMVSNDELSRQREELVTVNRALQTSEARLRRLFESKYRAVFWSMTTLTGSSGTVILNPRAWVGDAFNP